MSILLQAGEPITRPTFWKIGPIGKVVFYYLSVVAIVVFLWGTYSRFERYTQGQDDWFDRLDDLPERIVVAAKIVITNEKQFDRDGSVEMLR